MQKMFGFHYEKSLFTLCCILQLSLKNAHGSDFAVNLIIKKMIAESKNWLAFVNFKLLWSFCNL